MESVDFELIIFLLCCMMPLVTRSGQKAALKIADFECPTRPRTFKISAAIFLLDARLESKLSSNKKIG